MAILKNNINIYQEMAFDTTLSTFIFSENLDFFFFLVESLSSL
jgi:hypothetical protein